MPLSSNGSTVQFQSCGYCGQVLVAHHGYKWWMLPLGFVLACTGIGLIPLAVVLILLGNRTYQVCPNCKGQQLTRWGGEPDSESRRVFAEAKEIDDRTFKQNKLILFGVVMTMLAAALVFMFYMMRNP